jgi:hypothetical protein
VGRATRSGQRGAGRDQEQWEKSSGREKSSSRTRVATGRRAVVAPALASPCLRHESEGKESQERG